MTDESGYAADCKNMTRYALFAVPDHKTINLIKVVKAWPAKGGVYFPKQREVFSV